MGTVTSGAVDARAELPRGVRVAPPWLAKVLVAAALGAHAAVWGTDAPLSTMNEIHSHRSVKPGR